MNAFVSGSRKVIPAVLIYAFRDDQVLMLFGGKRWNGLGGKLEQDESPREAALREFREEAGVTIEPDQLQPLGVIQFPNFKPERSEDWVVWVFRAELAPSQVAWGEGPEGILEWVPIEKAPTLPMWPGDVLFFPRVLDLKDSGPILGTVWYNQGKVVRSEF